MKTNILLALMVLLILMQVFTSYEIDLYDVFMGVLLVGVFILEEIKGLKR